MTPTAFYVRHGGRTLRDVRCGGRSASEWVFVNDADRVLRPLRAAESSELRVESSELKGVDGGATGVDEQAL